MKPLNHYRREQIIWDAAIPGSEKLLLLALNSFVDGNGECWPGQESLAKMCGVNDRTIRNLCKSLECKGFIERSHRYKKTGRRTSDKFKVNFSVLLEDISASKSLPENHDITTGKSRQSLPENISRDLSRRSIQKIYPEDPPNPLKKGERDRPLEKLQKTELDRESEFSTSLGESAGPKKSDKPPKSKNSARRDKRRKLTAAECYEQAFVGVEPQWRDRFEGFWRWYSRDLCPLANAEAGSKPEAALAWRALIDTDFNGCGYEQFRKGCRLYSQRQSQNPVGIPHACRFLNPKQTATARWEDALEAEAISSSSATVEKFLPDPAQVPLAPYHRPYVPPPEEDRGGPPPPEFREKMKRLKALWESQQEAS